MLSWSQTRRPTTRQIRGDINWIVRLNHGWAPNGTIPLRPGYTEYGKRCADFVQRCKGADWFIVSNEPNHLQELPHGVRIEPEDYADCFNVCYAAIKTLRRDVNVCVAAVAPWDVTSGIDWLAYYRRMLARIDECDSLAIHGYTHGADPNLIWSTDKSKEGWLWHFPVIYQTILAIPPKFARKPVHVTETNQGDNAWADSNSGWVQNAYKSIHDHNLLHGTQKIFSLSLFRWRGDKWQIYDKPLVQADFKAAVSMGYPSPGPIPTPTPPEPTPQPPEPEPEPTPPPDGDYLIEWDPRLTQRGVQLTVAEAATGEWAWRCIAGEWFDEEQAQGRHNTYVTLLDANGNLVTGCPVRWFWADGQEVKDSEQKSDPWLGHPYSLDFGMYSPAPAYGVQVADGVPSDMVWGLGLGSIEQPQHKIHTSYSFTLRQIASAPTPPEPTPHTEYVIAEAGANLRAEPVSGEILVAVPYREAVTVLDRVDGSDGYDWSASSYQEVTGYIRADLLSTVQPEPILPPPEPSIGKLIWPVRNGRVTNWFGSREIDYSQFGIESHDGIDIAAPSGTPVLAVGDGKVMSVGNEPDGFGLFVRVWHAEFGFHSVYAHLSSQRVSVNQMVYQGTPLGAVGSTGNSSGNHLHISFRVGSESDYYRVHTGHKWGASDPMAIYSVVNRSDPNELIG